MKEIIVTAAFCVAKKIEVSDEFAKRVSGADTLALSADDGYIIENALLDGINGWAVIDEAYLDYLIGIRPNDEE